jgi:hypothetical protein
MKKNKNFLFIKFNIVYVIFLFTLQKGVPDEGCIGWMVYVFDKLIVLSSLVIDSISFFFICIKIATGYSNQSSASITVNCYDVLIWDTASQMPDITQPK